MASKTDRPASRRTRPNAVSNVELKANERLIKSRFYSWVLATGSGWERCVEEVARKTGVRIPVESLRQNLRPTNAKRGKPARSFKEDAHLRAIYDFACAEGYLSRRALSSRDDGIDVALGLSEYLRAEGPSIRLEGCFRAEIDHGLSSYTETFELSIVPGKKGGVTRVLVTETIGDPRSETPIRRLHRYGWMVSNGAGLVLMVARHLDEGRELYLILQSTPTLWSQKPTDVLVLFRHHGAVRVSLQFNPAVNMVSLTPELIPRNLLERSTLLLTRVDGYDDMGGARG